MLRIDISDVPPFTLSASADDRGRGSMIRYSKAGDPIPHASLHLWDLRRFDSDAPPPPRRLAQSTAESEKIITGVWWHPHDESLVYSVSDRGQSYRKLFKVASETLADASTDPKLLLHEKSPAWVEPPTQPGWLNDGALLWRSELPSGIFQLYLIADDGDTVRPVTPQGFNVRSFQVDRHSTRLFLTGDAEGGRDQHLYQFSLPGNEETPTQVVAESTTPGWHVTDISPDGRWWVDRHSTQQTPATLSVTATRTVSTDFELVSSLPRSAIVIEAAKLKTQSLIRKPECFSITMEDGTTVPAILVKPSLSKDARCPVVIEIYGGPAAAIVSSRWAGRRGLYRELLARRGIATLVVDNRSSVASSMATTWNIRGRFGEVEYADIAATVDWLKTQPWVDADRLAIRGWSFGGFLTLYAMMHSESFAAGIAGGSVTDWSEYDSFYTERYMGLPSTNASGYESSSLIPVAKNLSGKLLMIHGEVDDNVHSSHTLRMAGALQKAGKPFQMMIYPEAGHGITNPQQSWHLIQMIDQFLTDSLR